MTLGELIETIDEFVNGIDNIKDAKIIDKNGKEIDIFGYKKKDNKMTITLK